MEVELSTAISTEISSPNLPLLRMENRFQRLPISWNVSDCLLRFRRCWKDDDGGKHRACGRHRERWWSSLLIPQSLGDALGIESGLGTDPAQVVLPDDVSGELWAMMLDQKLPSLSASFVRRRFALARPMRHWRIRLLNRLRPRLAARRNIWQLKRSTG